MTGQPAIATDHPYSLPGASARLPGTRPFTRQPLSVLGSDELLIEADRCPVSEAERGPVCEAERGIGRPGEAEGCKGMPGLWYDAVTLVNALEPRAPMAVA